MKVVIFDSGTLINLSMNGLLNILEKLKKNLDMKFVITDYVKYEVIDRPVGIMRFELGALRIKDLLDKGVLESVSSLNLNKEKLEKETKKFMDLANHFIQVRGRWVNLVSEAESSCIALSMELLEKGIENIIAIDERTLRVLCENPSTLERIMSEKLHEPVKIVGKEPEVLSKCKFLRSTELVYVAFKKGIIDMKGEKVLEALIYATKFNGAAISFDEINVLKKL